MNSQELFQTFLGAGWPCWIALSDPRLAQVLGTTPGALRKAAWRGAMPVPLTEGAGHRQGVLLTDLAAWLVGASAPTTTSQPKRTVQHPSPETRRRPGRPRTDASVCMGALA